MKILFVEDEAALAEVATPALRADGFTVDEVASLSEARAARRICAYDAILLDRHLPDGDGLTLVRSLRAARDHTPVIVMSAARAAPEDRIDGLESGADDYMSKPMVMGELVARLKSVLRRPKALSREVIRVGNLEYALAERQATVAGERVGMPRRETDFLECLMRAQGRVVSRARLEESIYGFDDEVSVNAIDVSIHRLRRLLARAGSTAAIETVRGIGYLVREVPGHG